MIKLKHEGNLGDMKKINKTLEEKYDNIVKEESNKLAKFLKRRRLDLGLTLESVSEGICSTSYLSKIENCQVEVDHSYFSLLFEKLKLDYEAVLKARLVPVYPDIIRAYLNNDVNYLQDKVNKLVDNQAYCDIEVELLVLFYTVLTGKDDESENIIKKINQIENTLTDEELQVFRYLCLQFYFKNNELNLVSEGLKSILKANVSDKTLQIAYESFIIDYYYKIGDAANFNYRYIKFKDSEYFKVIKRIEFKHSLQSLILRCDTSLEELDDEFELLKMRLDDNNQDLFDYYYSLYLIKGEKYKEAYDYLSKLELDQDLFALLGIVVNHFDDVNISFEFLKLLREFNIRKLGSSYDYLEYLRLKFEQYSYGQLYVYLKTLVGSKDVYGKVDYLYEYELKEYYKVAFELGKYKEVVRFLNK